MIFLKVAKALGNFIIFLANYIFVNTSFVYNLSFHTAEKFSLGYIKVPSKK